MDAADVDAVVVGGLPLDLLHGRLGLWLLVADRHHSDVSPSDELAVHRVHRQLRRLGELEVD